jgi:choline dehydrogenase-like flavoprotein
VGPSTRATRTWPTWIELFGVDRAQAGSAYSLRSGTKVIALHVNTTGTGVNGVEARIQGQNWLFMAHQVVLAAGAVNTTAILLRSSSEPHPNGLANGSDQVGRNLIRPQLSSILQRASQPNSVRYSRSIGIINYYWGDKNVAFPLGSIQSGGGVLQDPHKRVSLRGKRLQIFYQANNLEGPRPAGQSLARHDPEAGGRSTHPGGDGLRLRHLPHGQ